jgi:hypothetical protein
VIERYFMEGVRFSWNKPPTRASNNNGAIVNSTGAANPMTYVGLHSLVSPHLLVSPPSTFGLTMRMNIPYDWCDYITGQTAQKLVGGNDILTGPMSGCYITRYNAGHGTCVGHIGTAENPAANTLVKRTFGLNMPDNTTGFNPEAGWPDKDTVAIKHKMALMTFALVTTAGDFYTVLMMPDSKVTGEWVCGGAKRFRPSPMARCGRS